MGKQGKHPTDTGRSRRNRLFDRAQLEFEDMLIDEFLDEHEVVDDVPGADIPVRYGVSSLAEHLSDSGIAAAILDSETFQASLQDEPLTVGDFYDGDLFELVTAQRRSEDLRVVDDAPEIAEAGPEVGRADAAEPVATFSAWGMLQGFLMGAAATIAVVVLLRMIV